MQSKLLLVDDNPGMIQVMARILSGAGQLRFATGGAAALKQARDFVPDLVLLDAEMPDMSGYEVCEAMKADPALADIPVIFVTGHNGPEYELKGLAIGAVDFIAKPISEPLLMARVMTQLRIKRLTDELRNVASIDALTQTGNRRSFDDAIAREWQRCLRNGDPISLLMIDVDHFKRFNDRYGHPAGDGCLRAVVQALRGAIMRPGDVVTRYGGEEFAVLLPQTPRIGAQHLANRVLEAVELLGIPHEDSATARHVTVSIGVSCCDASSRCWVEPTPDSNFLALPGRSAADLIQSADKALYAAKQAGRARAWFLDIDDLDNPELVSELPPRQAKVRRRPIL